MSHRLICILGFPGIQGGRSYRNTRRLREGGGGGAIAAHNLEKKAHSSSFPPLAAVGGRGAPVATAICGFPRPKRPSCRFFLFSFFLSFFFSSIFIYNFVSIFSNHDLIQDNEDFVGRFREWPPVDVATVQRSPPTAVEPGKEIPPSVSI